MLTVMQCLFRKGYLHVVSGSENKTSTSIRLQSPQSFMWRLFRWRRKWLNAKKDLSSSAVDGIAMNSFQIYTTFAAYFKHDPSAECERWHSTLCRLQKYLTTTTTKERESAALALMNIHCIIQIGL